MKHSLKTTVALLTAIGAIALPLQPASAQIVATFQNGNTNQEIDGYAGKAGDGWDTGWANSIHHTSVSTLTGTVKTDTPFGSGTTEYLQMTHTTSSETQAATATLYRGYKASLIDLTKNHLVSFQFRLDDATGFSGQSSDLIYFFDASTGRLSPGGGTTWVIGYSDQTEGWRFSNGGSYIDSTGMSLTVGTVYTLTIEVNPAGRSWDAVIHNGVTSIRASDFNGQEALAFHNNTATSAGGRLHFSSNMGARESGISYSIDQIEIAAIPEPGHAVLLLIGLGGAAAARLLKKS